MILHIPHVLSGDLLRQVQRQLADARWQDGRETAGPQAAQVKNNQQLAFASDTARRLRAVVMQALDHQPLLFSATLPKRVYPPTFNRYGGATNAYGNHVDSAVRHVPDTGQRVRTDLSCTLFLSEPADYEGGELVIEDGAQAHSVKLAAGDLVCYPGSHVHRVTPVTSGVRFASFFWIESLVRGGEQRRLLFEMDQALLRLREKHGESAEAVALTGVYHNLLRQWADT